MKLKVKKLHPDAIIPKYATEGSACFDLHAIIDITENKLVEYSKPVSFGTGLAFEIPVGYVMEVYSRSGHGFNSHTRLANCVGIIDSDYRGEVQVKLVNDILHTPLLVKRGDRIAQAKITKLEQATFEEVDELSSTERGIGGFGSTGQ